MTDTCRNFRPEEPLRTSLCLSCKAAMVWVRTRTGRHMPLDAAPEPWAEGKHLFTIENGMAVSLKGPGEGRTSHFATCPYAAAHRRKS